MSVSPLQKTLRLLCITLLVAVLLGCATGGKGGLGYKKRFIPPAERTGTAPEPGISQSDENLSITLDHLVCSNDPGSWMHDAPWDEYVVTVRNLAPERVTVSNARLVDLRGKYIDRGVDPWKLEELSKEMAREYQQMGVEVVISTVEGAILPVAAAPIPFFSMVFPLLHWAQQAAIQKDKEEVQKEFEARQLGHMTLNTFTLEPGADASGSIFVPIIPSPKLLVFDYMVESGGVSQSEILRVSLEKLQGLHVKADQAPGQSPVVQQEKQKNDK